MDIVSVADHGAVFEHPSFFLTLCLRRSYYLANHPNVLARLNSEIQSKLKGRTDFTREDLKKMGYLENVLKESTSLVLISRRKNLHQ